MSHHLDIDEGHGLRDVVCAVKKALAEAGGGPHTHAQADVTGLQAALDSKAATEHEHEPIAHDHDADYAALEHDHDAAYAAIGHDHNAAYEAAGAVAAHAAAADPHTGYQKESEKAQANGYASLDSGGKVPAAQLPAGSGAAWGGITGMLADQTDVQTALDGKSGTGHAHAGVYEPANANLQAHVSAAHAPANAQPNADITKGEIEAKLTGSISTHTHAGIGLGGAVAAPATTGAMTVNMTTHRVITITPTGNCTFNASGGTAGHEATFAITTSGTTSRTLTWGTNFRKVGILATGTVSARFFAVSFVCLDGTIWQEIARTAVQT